MHITFIRWHSVVFEVKFVVHVLARLNGAVHMARFCVTFSVILLV